VTTQRTFSRRKFVGAGAGAAAAAALGAKASAVLGAGVEKQAGAEADAYGGPGLLPANRIGLQLYSVRDQVSALGFAPVLQTLAQIGYKQVEFAGYTQGTTPEITVQQLRQLLDANGLAAVGSHVSPSNDASMNQILDDAEVLGLPQVGISFVIPTSGTTVAGWQTLADSYNHYGQLAAARGIGFYLHNHFQEWSQCTDNPLQRGEDVLLLECDPRYVFFELDIYWAYVGQSMFGRGATPFDPLLDYALPHRDRYRLWHVKDGLPNQAGVYPDPLDNMCDAGEGIIDFETFFCTVGQIDTHTYLWERDNASSHPQGALVSAEWSYVYMRHGLVSCGPPTAVDVRGFGAEGRRRRVELTWETSSELDVVGFNVWRIAKGRSRRLNRALVPARHAGESRGASYRLVDRSARPGVLNTYRLQRVGRNGSRSWVDTATATAR
jgi:sugar phosphate isomerase/epimerase